jgi:hypothetical protein
MNAAPDLPSSNYELQAFVNLVYRIDALLEDLGLFHTHYDIASLLLQTTLQGKVVEEKTLSFYLRHEADDVRAWGQYLRAAEKLRAREFDDARASFKLSSENTRNVRLRDLALLGEARAAYWKARNKQLAHGVAKASLSEIKARIRRKNLMDDIDYYLAKLEAS